MEKSVIFGVLLTIYTEWLIMDLVRSRGKSLSKIMRRAAIFFAVAGWFLYLLSIGAPVVGAYNNSAFKIFISLGFLVIMGLFVAPHTNLKKGTPDYELVKGALLLVVATILIGVIGYNFWF